MAEETESMPDEETGLAEAAPETAEGEGVSPGDAWRDVIAQLDGLGDAMGRWARAAASDPAHRERAQEIKEHAQRLADSVGSAVDDAVATDVGQSLRDAAEKAGVAVRQASERISDEVAPRMASAFRGAAEKLHQAAERLERSRAEEAAAADAGAAAPDQPGGDEPEGEGPEQE